MLVRATKRNFNGICEAAKQLLIWSFNKKQDFHSNYQNGDYSSYRNRRPNFSRKKWDMSDYNELEKKEFKLEELKPIEKNFYTPHSNVLNRSESEIKDFHDKHSIKIFGENVDKCPGPIFSFDELDLPDETVNVIRKLNYTEPTPIQSQTWPIALSGFNMVGVAQTGSGKTLGFVLPGLIHMKHQPPLERNEGPLALVLSPTRELAQQTNGVFMPFARSFSFKTACVFGGIPKERQFYQLQSAHVCVGTPGRVIDFLRSGDLDLSRCTYFVLDEADRLLNMGFEPQIRAVMNKMRPDSQVLMWSATWPREVRDLATDYLKDYIGVKFGSSELTVNSNITQIIHVCEKFKKREMLLKLITEISEKEDNKTLVFAQTKNMVFQIYRFLSSSGFSVTLLHGDKSQKQRDTALSMFRSGSVKILVGTEVVGRGLDITDIRYVINYDFPNDIEEYVHIVGRTGRYNQNGTAYTLFTPEDANYAADLIKILNQTNQEVNPELMNLANQRHESLSRRNHQRRYYNPSQQRRYNPSQQQRYNYR